MPEGIVSHRDFNQPPEKIPTIGSIQRDFVQPGSRFEKITRDHNLMLEIRYIRFDICNFFQPRRPVIEKFLPHPKLKGIFYNRLYHA